MLCLIISERRDAVKQQPLSTIKLGKWTYITDVNANTIFIFFLFIYLMWVLHP